MDVKKLKKFTKEEIERRTKARVDFPMDIQLTSLCGGPVQRDTDGTPFALIPGYPDFLKQLADLHPDWKVSEPFMDLEE